jgi:pre-mRNA-splicing factor SYF1
MCLPPPPQKVDAIIRSGLSRFSDEVGRLWCRLADFYIRSGQFERARDVFEEAVASVTTVCVYCIRATTHVSGTLG